jgi:hypothetical protein
MTRQKAVSPENAKVTQFVITTLILEWYLLINTKSGFAVQAKSIFRRNL